MNDLATSPAFGVYCITAVALCLNLLGLWLYSGVVRGGTKTTLNPEDAVTVSRGADVVGQDPPGVARVLRAHTNAQASIPPFLLLALLYVILGAGAKMAWILFGGFAFSRYAHSVVYLAGKQPWRTIFFVLGCLCTLGVVIEVVRRALPLL
ncbi:Hypothetical protein A7982_00955 [Minicystis rosea]|nr:Hypothetical protein A7982_00955 [Minicystis rosea]